MPIAMAFAMGLGGQLYLHIPSLGVIPMLDLLAYALSVILLILQLPRMGRYAKRSVFWGLAWSGAAIFAGMMNFVDSRYFLKSVVIVSSSWAIMLVAWRVLKADARLYLFYLVGAGLGGYIGLYYFQPGTVLARELGTGFKAIEVLMEKEKYPVISRAIFMAGFLPICMVWRKIPAIILAAFTMGCGFFLLLNGGSRSYFGFFLIASVGGFLVVTMPKIAMRMAKHTSIVIFVGVLGAVFVFGLYAHLAKSGALGEGEFKKYEAEEEVKMNSGEGRLSTRGSFMETWEVFKKQPWGEGGTNIRHSVISNSMNCEGIVGLLFWVYFSCQVLWFLKNRMSMTNRYSFFLILQVMTCCWAMIGSPFGARHIYFVLMMFIAHCRDNPCYGLGTVFDVSSIPYRRRFG